MSSAPPVELFKGKDWEECDSFIRAIRARALWEGKQRDLAWIADFAAPQFSRKALSWHCQLPEDIRQDWSKLEIALINRWPAPEEEEDDDEPQIEPTPAAAPSLNRIDQADVQPQGFLRFALDGSDTKYYVDFGSDICTLRSDVNRAMRVRCNSLHGTTLLERIDRSDPFWLAVHWASPTPEIGDGSSDFAFMSWVDPVSLKSSWSRSSPWQLITYTLLDSGEIVPIWKKDDASKIRLFAVSLKNNLVLVADLQAFFQSYTSPIRGKLILEPTS